MTTTQSKAPSSGSLSLLITLFIVGILFTIAIPTIQSVRTNALTSAATTQLTATQNALFQREYEDDSIDDFVSEVNAKYTLDIDSSNCAAVVVTVTDKANPEITVSRTLDLSDFESCSF